MLSALAPVSQVLLQPPSLGPFPNAFMTAFLGQSSLSSLPALYYSEVFLGALPNHANTLPQNSQPQRGKSNHKWFIQWDNRSVPIRLTRTSFQAYLLLQEINRWSLCFKAITKTIFNIALPSSWVNAFTLTPLPCLAYVPTRTARAVPALIEERAPPTCPLFTHSPVVWWI